MRDISDDTRRIEMRDFPFRPVKSSFLTGISYCPVAKSLKVQAPGQGIVLVRTQDHTYAYLAPSWVYGLLCAAKSPGRVYNRLLKSKKLQSVKIN